jgi:hypothetical protein
MKGKWRDAKTGDWYIENSFWVNGITLKEATELAGKFDQDSVIWGQNGRWDLYDRYGNKLDKGGTEFHVEPMDRAMALELPLSFLRNKKELAIRLSGRKGLEMDGINTGIIDDVMKLGSRLSIEFVPYKTITLTDSKTGKEIRKMAVAGELLALNSFSGVLRISDDIKKNWIINPNNILDSRTRQGREFVDRFSWNPDTGEFVPGMSGEMHALAIGNRGESSFDDYVRGAVLRAKKLITFRPYAPPGKTARLDDAEINVLSFEAQYACQDILRNNGADKWNFQYNVSNKQLQEMTRVRT